jgi:hypothetical protein
MAKKQKSTKAGNSRKASKVPATARTPKAPRTRERDPRLPAAGTTLTREYKGKTIRVSVLDEGFRCDGKDYRSLSALASELCGNPANGFLWFGLIERKIATPKRKPAKSKEKSGAPKETAPETAPAAASATT